MRPSTTASKSILALADQAVVSGASFLTTVLLGRVCGAAELGVSSLGATLVVLIGCVENSLISTPYTVYGNRLEGAARTAYAGSVLAQQGMFTLVEMLCLSLAAATFSAGIGMPQFAPVLWVLVGAIPFISLREFARRMALAHLRTGKALLLDAAVAVVQLGALAGLAVAGWLSAVTAYVVLGLACAVAGLIWLRAARRDFKVRLDQLPREMRRNWSFGKWVLASQVAASLNAAAVPWLLAIMLDQAATGVFAACLTVVVVSNPLLLGIGNVLGPRAARAFAEGGGRETHRVVRKATLWLGAVMAVFCTLLALVGGAAVSMLYGHQFVGYQQTITVLTLSALVSALGMGAGYGLWAVERSASIFHARLLGLCTTFLTSAYLIHILGVTGAAYGLLAGNLVTTATMQISYRAAISAVLKTT